VAVARQAVTGIGNVDVDELDLSDLESVRRFAERFLASDRHADMVINSAGIMACPETRVGSGWEAQFAVNHLGHFALLNGIWPALKGGARVIAVSSGAHSMGVHWEDVHFQRNYDKWLAYGQSKAANVLFAAHLDMLGRAANVRAFALHPGSILTPLQRHLGKEEMIAAGWIDAAGNLADATFKTLEQGAATQVWAATSPQLDGMGGLYCEDCDIARLADGDGSGVAGHALDAAAAERLWDLSAELTGVDVFATAR
jgi:NAD(P)-dependent dehydrogenase (short-subunit alcohol dehydrogenase family)